MIVSNLAEQRHSLAGIVAFGFFDAIHLGHRRVIEDAVRLARESGVPASVVLFENNIFPLIGVEKYPIYSFSERVRMIESLGIDRIFYIHADAAFLSLTASEFLEYLSDRLMIVGFTCGRDFTFGKGGLGTPRDLSEHIGGVSLVSDLCTIDGEKVSTEGVKRALESGDMVKAARFLGRPFSLKRPVHGGRKDGKKMGYPTINFDLGHLPLQRGVYFSAVLMDGVRYPALTNVGGHPTFSDARENIETYILDFSGDLYDREIEVEFLSYRRPIRSFERVEDLIRTIDEDVAARRKYD